MFTPEGKLVFQSKISQASTSKTWISGILLTSFKASSFHRCLGPRNSQWDLYLEAKHSSTQNRAELSLNAGDSGGEHFQHAELAHHALKVPRDAKMAQWAKALSTNAGGLSLIFGTE